MSSNKRDGNDCRVQSSEPGQDNGGVMSSLMAQRIIFSTHTYSGAELIVLGALAWHADDSGVVSKISVPA